MEFQVQELLAEITRLQLIVRLLADRNCELEALLAGQNPNAFSTSMQKVEGATKSFPASMQNLHGGTQPLQTTMQNLQGAMYPLQTTLQNLQGAMHPMQSSDPNAEGATKRLPIPMQMLPGRMQGLSEALSPINGAKTTGKPQSTDAVGGKNELPDVAALMRRLKKNGMARIKDSGVERTARLMLWAARESGPISYAEMKRSFGMTGGGVAKLVASVLRRGWLRRQGVHAFALTDKGQLLLSSPG